MKPYLAIIIVGLICVCGPACNDEETTEETAAPVAEPPPVSGEATDDPAAVLEGGTAAVHLREEIDALAAAQTELLGELATRVGRGDLTPEEADEEHRAWLTERAAELELSVADLERLLGGWIGGRLRR